MGLSPSAPLPQQWAAPPAVRAEVYPEPTCRLAKLTPAGSATGVGVARGSLVPSPSCPLTLSPQQYTAPAVVTMHVWANPTPVASGVTPSGIATITGVGPLFHPQQ